MSSVTALDDRQLNDLVTTIVTAANRQGHHGYLVVLDPDEHVRLLYRLGRGTLASQQGALSMARRASSDHGIRVGISLIEAPQGDTEPVSIPYNTCLELAALRPTTWAE